MKKSIWFIALLGFMSACAPRLSTQERSVMIVSNRELLAECKFLGPVLGEERFIGGLLLSGQAKANARARLQREVVQLGGDTVVIATSDAGIGGAQALGEAYRCNDGNAD